MWLSLIMTALTLGADDAPQPRLDSTELGIPFQRYTTTDSLGRTIVFYLSRSPMNEPAGKLPVALFIQGSGCQSLFRKNGDQILGGLQNVLLREAKGRVRVLVVEKPGVKFLDVAQRPGTAEGAAEEFLQEHTLPRWAEANRAALRAVWTLPEIDGSRTLVVGHSEGGIVAARIAAVLTDVTHVASLAGGGPTQLFSLAESRRQPKPEDQSGDAERRVQSLYEGWAKVLQDSDSTTQFWLSHPYRRWSSFLSTSVGAELSRTKARIFLAQGALDTSVPPTAHDMLVAELRVNGRDFIAERIDSADHGFRTAEQPPGSPAGMQALFGRVLDWFIEKK
jgi:dienelactone hydrolase